MYISLKCQLYIDLNAFNKFDFSVYVYYIKKINKSYISKQKSVKSIFFLSRLLNNTEI